MVVDLLVSLAYIALAEGAPDAPLPVGMGLRVECRTAPVTNKGPDGLFDFDRLDINDVWSLIPSWLRLRLTVVLYPDASRHYAVDG